MVLAACRAFPDCISYLHKYEVDCFCDDSGDTDNPYFQANQTIEPSAADREAAQQTKLVEGKVSGNPQEWPQASKAWDHGR